MADKSKIASNKALEAPDVEQGLTQKDPFFALTNDSEWNACIGQQGEEENYIDGYIEAAMELADAVIEKKLHSKRDTLVLPILYNARHAVELALKFAAIRLHAAGLIKSDVPLNHDISAYWQSLFYAAIGDERLNEIIAGLKHFVVSLAKIDNDGQELRYHRNRSDDPSLANYSLANLDVIRTSLIELSKIIQDLRYRTVGLIYEINTGTYTTRCSRSDLLNITKLMPKRDQWKGDVFDVQKAAVCGRFRLSSKEFQKALKAIQACRETKAYLGIETELLHLSDDDIVAVVQQWRRMHPKKSNDEVRTGMDQLFISNFAQMFEGMEEHLAIQHEVIAKVETMLSPDKLSDLEAIFYMARDKIFSEYYEQRVERAKKKYKATKNLKNKILHIMNKTNFLICVQHAALKLGRLTLAQRLENL